MSAKRKRLAAEAAGVDEPPVKKVRERESTVRWFSVRWTRIKDEKNEHYMDPDTFVAMGEAFKAQLEEWTDGSQEGYCFQLEAPGDSLDNMHYQGDFHSMKKMRPKHLASLVNGVFRGIEITPSSENGKGALRKYVQKTKTRLDGPWTNNKDLDEKLHPKYNFEDVKTFDELRPFQQSIVEACQEPVDNRTIHWVCDKRGSVGKTELGKHLTRHCDAVYVTYGDAKSLTHYISENMHKKAYVFDLSRCKPADFAGNDVYSVMEGLKNGRLINLKYMSKKIEQASAHVWVFANQYPKKEVLSSDRWKIWGVTNDFKLEKFNMRQYIEEAEREADEAALQKLIKDHKKKEREKRAKENFLLWKASLSSYLMTVPEE